MFRTLMFAFLTLIWAGPAMAGEMDFQEVDQVELSDVLAPDVQSPRLKARRLGVGLAMGGPGAMQLMGGVSTGTWLLASAVSAAAGILVGTFVPSLGALGAVLGAGLTVGFMTDARPGWTTLGALVGLVVSLPVLLIVYFAVVVAVIGTASTGSEEATLGAALVGAVVLWSIPALFMGAGAAIAGNKDMEKNGGSAKLGPTMVRHTSGKHVPAMALAVKF